jgi:hypothetical protein
MSIQDKIIQYDLTGTYFEGTVRHSETARRGRGKEKRNDSPLLVPALSVNADGFIRYSSIYEGYTDAGVNSRWTETVRVMNTQKCVTAVMTNNRRENISVRRCSRPTLKVAMIYDALKLKHASFVRKKSAVLNCENFKNRKPEPVNNTS